MKQMLLSDTVSPKAAMYHPASGMGPGEIVAYKANVEVISLASE